MDTLYAYVDTCVMAEVIIGLDADNSLNPSVGKYLSPEMLLVLNQIKGEERFGKIITSSFTFVELINKYSSIFAKTSISITKLYALMKQPPEWLIIEPVNELTERAYCEVPTSVEGESISMDDAIHIATAIQRNDNLYFLTTDHVLRKLKIPAIIFV